MYTKKIYFSGGDVRELQEIFNDIPGVTNTAIGTLSAVNVHSYVEPEPQDLENISSVEITFNPKKMDLSMLMDILFNVLNPYADKTLGVYYRTGEDEPQVELHVNFIANRGKEPVVSKACLTINDPNSDYKRARKCFIRVGRMKNFVAAPESEQNFFGKNPEKKTDIDLTKFKNSLRF
ncbi:MAG: peptide-methionine (S)-S-oxide reductase [Selenomonadaceae bacterium]|nr:peptide-methionine (S)-S-oxide reductase [Selenomonadaceae bacterium]